MTLVMAYFFSPTGSCSLVRESFELGGFKVSLRDPSVGACSSFKSSSGESWRTWFSGKQGTKLSAGSIQRSNFDQPMGLSGFKLHKLQLDERSTVSHSKVIASTELERSMYSVKEILEALGRALLILGVGLSLSRPASARTVVPPVSEVSSAGDVQESAIHGVKFMKEPNGNVDAVHARTDPSHECDESNNPTEYPTSNASDTSETPENRLRLSEAFWSGLPTVEGSLLYRMKAQLERNPGDSRALEALLQAVLEQQDMLRALTIVETLLELEPENWHWKLLKARTHELLGELLMAKQDYEELLSLHPLSARFLQGLAMLLSKVGEQTQGLELIQNALNQALSEGKDVEARDLGVLLSQFYIQSGNFEDALHHLSNMIEQNPNDYRPYLCQGLAYTLMNQMDKAKNSFEKYMEVCPPDAFDHNYFDELLLKAKAKRQIDALKKNAMKGTFRNRKTSKPMKHPSLFGNWNYGHEQTSE